MDKKIKKLKEEYYRKWRHPNGINGIKQNNMNKLDKDYQALLQDILENGVEKNTRNGKVLSVFGRTIRYKFKDGKFPLLTTKKMYFKGIVTELLWFLRGSTNIKFLVDNDCHIWDGDCFSHYKVENQKLADVIGHGFHGGRLTQEEFINKIKTDDEFAKKWGELGPVYGRMWRAFDEDANGGIDQIANLISDLKTNPDSRRLLVTAWNPTYLPHQVLPPCHYGFQVYTRELSGEERWELLRKKVGDDIFKNWVDDIMPFGGGLSEELRAHNIPTRAISLMFNMRSNDVPLGLPFNIASYALLLEIIGKMVNMAPDELIANLGDAHIYKNQIDGVKEQLTRTPMRLPTLIISDDVNFNSTIDEFLESCNKDSFKLDGYESHPSIKMPLSN